MSSKYDGPERDLKNFPRPVRPEFGAKVRYGFIPENWFEFMYKKTGVTGPYVLGVGFTTYLLSKEVWVIEHDFYYVPSFFCLVWLVNKKFGKTIADMINKQVDETENKHKELRADMIRNLEEAVKREEAVQWQADGQELLLDAKRTNVKMQLEASFRERAMQVYTEVKKRLDYQVEKQRIDQMIAQKHMVQWVVSNVLKSLSAQQEQENLKRCISDLQSLAAKA